MSKFSDDIFYDEEIGKRLYAFNKYKFNNKNKMLEITSKELDIPKNQLKFSNQDWVVCYGFYTNYDDELCNGYNLRLANYISSKINKIPVWVVEGVEKGYD